MITIIIITPVSCGTGDHPLFWAETHQAPLQVHRGEALGRWGDRAKDALQDDDLGSQMDETWMTTDDLQDDWWQIDDIDDLGSLDNWRNPLHVMKTYENHGFTGVFLRSRESPSLKEAENFQSPQIDVAWAH